MRIEGIGQIMVTAQNLDRAVGFYRDTLGLKFLFQAPPQMAFFECGGVRLLVGVPERKEFAHAASTIYYKVADIEAAAAELRGKGVVFLGGPSAIAKMPTHTLWLAEFKDSEGNVVALMSEVPH